MELVSHTNKFKKTLEGITESKEWNFWKVEEIEKTLEENHNHLFYLFDGGNVDIPKGLVLFSIVENNIEILYLFVQKTYRKQGFGLLILSKLEDYFQNKIEGSLNMYFEVRASHDGTIRLYEKFGARKIGVRKKYYSDLEDAFIYLKS
tara:strand:- start:151 stop:594 length:444 start_codon:yes stop_codon:yes gene_type:complete